MKEIEQIETTVEQLRERDEGDVQVDLSVLADKLEAIAEFAARCRDEREAADRLVAEMREKLDQKYVDGYRSALNDVRAQVDGLEEAVG